MMSAERPWRTSKISQLFVVSVDNVGWGTAAGVFICADATRTAALPVASARSSKRQRTVAVR